MIAATRMPNRMICGASGLKPGVAAPQLYDMITLRPMMKNTIVMTIEAFCSRRGIADEHDVPLLLRSLPNDLDGPLLPDHLVDEPFRDLDLGRAAEIHLVNPGIHRGQLVRYSRGLHHV